MKFNWKKIYIFFKNEGGVTEEMKIGLLCELRSQVKHLLSALLSYCLVISTRLHMVTLLSCAF